MEIPTVPPPPAYIQMPEQEHVVTPTSRFRKVKAAKAIQTLLGLFQKTSKKKSENEKDSLERKSPTSVTMETKISDASSTPGNGLKSQADSKDGSSISNSEDRNSHELLGPEGSSNTAMLALKDSKNYRLNEDGLSKIGNYDEDEFQDIRENNADEHSCSDSDDVFMNESYFEDDYYEDYSGNSNPGADLDEDEDEDEKIPIFTPSKRNIRAKSCNCEMNSCVPSLVNNFGFEHIYSLGSKLARHSSMPCLSKLSSMPMKTTDFEDPPRDLDHLLQSPEQYFTLGMDMITNHFGHVNASTGENAQGDIVDSCEATRTKKEQDGFSQGFSFQPTLNSVQSKALECTSTTPVKQTYSIDSFECSTPLTPNKKRRGESGYGNSILAKKGQRSRKILYKDERSSLLKSEFSEFNRKTRIADGLSIVADWIMHVVALNGSKVGHYDLTDAEINHGDEKGGTVDSCQQGASDMDRSPLNDALPNTLADSGKFSTSPAAEKCEYFFESNEVREDRKVSAAKESEKTHRDYLSIDPRPRLESGYASRSRCSTPTTPFSEPPTPMSKLQTGKAISPKSLNKLDGLTIYPLNGSRRGSFSPKFLFPPAQSSLGLKAVPEVSESLLDFSDIVDKSPHTENNSPVQNNEQSPHRKKHIPEQTACLKYEAYNSLHQNSKKQLHDSAEIDGDGNEIIISGGGDAESLVSSSVATGSACSSSASGFWSASSTVPRDRDLNVSINVIDENNNYIQQVPFQRFQGKALPDISSTAISKIQPISSSSPLHAKESHICDNTSLKSRVDDLFNGVSSKQEAEELSAARGVPDGKVESGNKVAPKGKGFPGVLPLPHDKKKKSSASRSSRSARTCLRFDDRDICDAKRVDRRRSEEYIILKKVANFIISLIFPKFKVKSHVEIPALMENLKENYLRLMKEDDDFKGIHHISRLKIATEREAEIFNPLTIRNCLDKFFLSILIQHKDKTNSCADFVFQNLPLVVKGNPVFFSLAPELVVLLLGNDHCIVKGPNGFPLPYRASEKEVLKAAVKFAETRLKENPQNTRVQKLLYEVVDPSIVAVRKEASFSTTDRTETTGTAREQKSTLVPRVKHIISYCLSDCPRASDISDGKLTIVPKDSQMLESKPFGVDTPKLYELSKLGTVNVEAPIDIGCICDEEHFLRTLYFCYGSRNGVPFIADIGMQYVSRGKKKTLFVASPVARQNTSPGSCDDTSRERSLGGERVGNGSVSSAEAHRECTPSSPKPYTDKPNVEVNPHPVNPHPVNPHPVNTYPVSDQPCEGPLKKAAMILAPGEHITAVSVLGTTDLHNIEIVTNTKRRVRAHALATDPGMPWTRIAAPRPEGAPFCLHALVGETRNSAPGGTRVGRISAVWAMTSWEANDLNR